MSNLMGDLTGDVTSNVAGDIRSRSLKILTVAPVLLIFCACNPSGIDYSQVPSKAKNTVATVSESDYNTDTQNLQSAQAGLEAFGLKFQSQPGTQDLVWDGEFQRSFLSQNPNIATADEVTALKTFSKTANDYIKKYGTTFHLTHKNGTDEIKKLDDASVANLKAQIALVKSELAKINPNAPKGDGHKPKASISEPDLSQN